MKAERRHELKSNSLSRGVENLPEFWRAHGNKLLLVLIAILLAIIVVRYRNAESENRERIAKQSLTAAEMEISQLRNTAFWNYSPDSIAGIKSQHAGDAEDYLTRTLENADDSNVRARAYVDRGDLNFLLANFATLPPTTRPTTATPRTSDEYLSAAESAYNEVLKEPLSRSHLAVCSAKLGLAAVAENRSAWDKARQNYEAVFNDAEAPQAIKDYAKLREDQLTDLSRKPFIGTAQTEPAFAGPELPATESTSQPADATTGPAVRPATGPTTTPVTSAPTTGATTRP